MKYEFIMTQDVVIETEETDYDIICNAVVLSAISRDPKVKIIIDKTTDIEILEDEPMIDLSDTKTPEEKAQPTWF
jgi:hypothetical protein